MVEGLKLNVVTNFVINWIPMSLSLGDKIAY